MTTWQTLKTNGAALILRALSILSPAYACRAFDDLVALIRGGQDPKAYSTLLLAKVTRSEPLDLSPDQARAAFSLWAYKIVREDFNYSVKAIFEDLNNNIKSIENLLYNICQTLSERDLEHFFSSLSRQKAALLVKFDSDSNPKGIKVEALDAILRNPHIDNGDEVLAACKAILQAVRAPEGDSPLHKDTILECLEKLNAEPPPKSTDPRLPWGNLKRSGDRSRPLALLALAQTSISLPSSEIAEIIGDEMRRDLPISARASILAIALVRNAQNGGDICLDLMRKFHEVIDEAIKADLESHVQLPPQMLCAALEVFCHAADYAHARAMSQPKDNPPWSEASVERLINYLRFRAPHDGRLSAQVARYLLSPYTPYPNLKDYFDKHPNHVDYALDLNLISYITKTCLTTAHLHLYGEEDKLPLVHLNYIKQAFEKLPDRQKAVALQMTARWLRLKYHTDVDYHALLEKVLWPMIQSINSVVSLDRISRYMNAHESLDQVYNMLHRRMGELRALDGPALARMAKGGHDPGRAILGVGRPDLVVPMLLNLAPRPIARKRLVRLSMNMVRLSLFLVSLPFFLGHRLATVHTDAATRSEKAMSNLINGHLNKKHAAALQQEAQTKRVDVPHIPIRVGRRPPFNLPMKLDEVEKIARQAGYEDPYIYAQKPNPQQQPNTGYTY